MCKKNSMLKWLWIKFFSYSAFHWRLLPELGASKAPGSKRTGIFQEVFTRTPRLGLHIGLQCIEPLSNRIFKPYLEIWQQQVKYYRKDRRGKGIYFVCLFVYPQTWSREKIQGFQKRWLSLFRNKPNREKVKKKTKKNWNA